LNAEGQKVRKREGLLAGKAINHIKGLKQRRVALMALKLEIESRAILKTVMPGTVLFYINKIMFEKKPHLKPRSYDAVLGDLKIFNLYLDKYELSALQPSEISRAHIHEFINYLFRDRKVCNRTVNNYMISVNSFFNYLVKHYPEVCSVNPCSNFSKLPSRSQAHTAYTEDQLKEISAWLQEHEPYLHFYIKWIAYAFMRPAEIRNLKIETIDFNKMTVKLDPMRVKTQQSRHKKILAVFHSEVLKLKGSRRGHYVFTNGRKPGSVRIGENYFKKRFAKLKKYFCLDKHYTMYSFRHTFVSMLIKNGADKYEVMKYTGHTTLSSFENYIRSIFATEPVDLSDKISMRI
jgi:integrase